jgi:hypothetical protein
MPRQTELLESRTLMAADLRTIDGSGNNLSNTDWGSTNESLIRLVAAAYANGTSTPAGATRSSARAISNAIAEHPEDVEILSGGSLSAFAYLWGQFIDHDLDLTTSASPAESFNVPVPTGDESFDPAGTGTQLIPLSRSKYVTDANGVRQQVNDITAYLDGSMIYGSDLARANALREFSGGRLLTSDGDLLPYNTMGLTNANDAHIFSAEQLFAAGDVRANENAELTALHTLFLREHNRQADHIAAANPTWKDEQIYQKARQIVIGEIQNITYNEFLPALIGDNALSRYTGYQPGVNAGISNEFSTAAFRLGHSMLTDDVEFINDDGTESRDPMALSEVFFNPTVIEDNGIDVIMKYVASSNAEEIDSMVVDSVRNFLFGPPGSGGLDLVSLNIQRGRDHGLASYNDTRAALGLSRMTSFSQITSDATLAADLQAVYGSVDNVDLWVGGLAENHARGSNVGPTFQRILVDQFTRTRDGDRFWYERDLNFRELSMVRGTSLADIVKANTELTNLQRNVFIFDVDLSGQIYADADKSGSRNSREIGVAGITLQLLDGETAEVVDSVVTTRDGRYVFENVGLGDYTIQPLLPTGVTLTTAASHALSVSRGGDLRNYDFGVQTSPRLSTPGRPGHGGRDGDRFKRLSLSDVLT